MAFPATSILDDFLRPDGDWGSNWTTAFGDAAPVIVSQQGTSSGGGWSGAIWNQTTFSGAEENWWTVQTTSDNRMVIYLRLDGSGNGYALDLNTLQNVSAAQNFHIAEVATFSLTTIASTRQDIASGDSFGLQAVGSTLTAWYKAAAGAWTAILSTSDPTFPRGGSLGVEIFNNVTRVAPFGGGSIPGLSDTAPIIGGHGAC
jgi:hypothetical protein